MKKTIFTGVGTAIVTPMNADGSINYDEFGKLIEFREADATKMSLPTDKGLLVCNPPYGERMLEQRSAQRLYSAFGRHLKYADGWKKYIISSEPEFERYRPRHQTFRCR
mgnify:CR=1 FL=1